MTPPVRMTAAQYAALGAPEGMPATVPARKRSTRIAAARAGAVTVCHTCGERFTTDAAETRHVLVHPARFEWEYRAAMSDTPTVPDPLDPDGPDPAPDADE